MPRSTFCPANGFLGISLLALFLSTSSCSTHNPWVVQKVQANDKCFCSTKLSYPAKDSITEIDLELLKIEQTIEMFLAIHSRPVPADPTLPNETALNIKTDSQTISSSVIRHKGGQKFTVSKQDSEFILEHLRNQESVTIILPGYQTTIDPNGFLSSYERFTHPVYLSNPFHLPF